jgi:hypothetical protein
MSISLPLEVLSGLAEKLAGVLWLKPIKMSVWQREDGRHAVSRLDSNHVRPFLRVLKYLRVVVMMGSSKT